MGFPAFYFDTDRAFGRVGSVEEFNRLVRFVSFKERRRLEDARENVLDATDVAAPEARVWPEGRAERLGCSLEEWGELPNFGHRAEHLGGTLTLREWLRERGVLVEVT